MPRPKRSVGKMARGRKIAQRRTMTVADFRENVSQLRCPNRRCLSRQVDPTWLDQANIEVLYIPNPWESPPVVHCQVCGQPAFELERVQPLGPSRDGAEPAFQHKWPTRRGKARGKRPEWGRRHGRSSR
jgi:hypothetical protein